MFAQKQIFDYESDPKNQNIQNCHPKKIPEQFGYNTSEPIGFYEDVVINLRIFFFFMLNEYYSLTQTLFSLHQ